MAKERFLTVMIPIKDGDCEATVYPDLSSLASAVPASAENVNKIYKLTKDGYARAWLNPATGVYEYHIVTDREFPYLGNPLEIYDFTYDATRMGTAPTISAQGVMRYARIENGVDVTLDGLWNQQCHVVFNGKKLYLKQIPTSVKSNEDARYRYDLDFVDASVVLESVYLYDVVSPFITDKPLSESASFSFYGDINELAKRINASLIRSGLASLTRKYVDYDDPYYEPLLPTMTVPYLTYEQWTLVNTNPHSLVPSVFSNDYGWQVFRYEIYIPLHGDYNRYLMDYIYENEDGVYALTGYQCKIGKDKYGNPSTSEEKLITFENNTIHEALQQFHDTFGLEYYITSEKDDGGNFTGNTFIVIGDCEHDFADIDPSTGDFVRDDEGIPTSSQPFDYGSTKALLSKEKTNTTDKIVTRITGVGSSENIPWYYPNPSPDGWIRPFFTEHGVEQPNVTIDYPINEGDTSEEYALYERFLKNRIGVPIKRGVVKDVLFGTDYNMALPVPSEDYYILVFYYKIDTRGVELPRITLELDYNPSESKCTRLQACLMRGGNVVDSYDTNDTYDSPTMFQTMFLSSDGKHQTNIAPNDVYTLQIVYYIPKSEMPYSQHFDYEGYHYISRALQLGETGYYGYVGENFYQVQDLLPFIDWAILGQTLPHVYDTGYSVDGTKETKILPIQRNKGKYYKDIGTGVIYLCFDSSDTEIGISQGEHRYAFEENPVMSGDEWFKSFVTMRLRVYESKGWYINNKKVFLSDYGLSLPYQPSGYVDLDIFNAIEFQRVKWVTPIPNLMPEVFIKTDGERRFYNAHNYWDAENETLLAGTADTMTGEVQVDDKVRNPIYKENETDADDKHYEFENEYIQQLPHEHIEDFEDIKPTIEGQHNHVAVTISEDTIGDWANQYQNYFTKNVDGTFSNATSTYDASETYYILLRIDVVEAFAYDETDNDEIWEDSNDGSIQGEYKHPYFFAKLRPMGFNIFDLALQEDMVLSMTTGNCGACNFKIGVDENSKKNPIQLWEYDVYKGDALASAEKIFDAGTLRRYVDLNGLYYDTDGTQAGYKPIKDELGVLEGDTPFNFDSNVPLFWRYNYTYDSVTNGMVGTMKQNGKVHFEGDVVTNGRFIESQQDTTENYVWVALMKDTESYGVIMPSARPNYNDPTLNQYIEPKGIEYTNRATGEQSTFTEDQADKFVLTNIRLPQIYLRRAERELSRNLVKYMYDHNWQRFKFSINFSRIFLAENASVDDVLNENSVLYVFFNGNTYRQYVKHYTYRMTHDVALPEISVDMDEELSVSRTLTQQWDAKSRKDGSKMLARFGAITRNATSRIDKTAMKKDGTAILSGNIVIQGEGTSLIEIARRAGGTGGSEGTYIDNSLEWGEF